MKTSYSATNSFMKLERFLFLSVLDLNMLAFDEEFSVTTKYLNTTSVESVKDKATRPNGNLRSSGQTSNFT